MTNFAAGLRAFWQRDINFLMFYQKNVKIKIALPKDEVRILIKILLGDHWAFVFRGGKIDHLNATYRWTELIGILVFKAMIPGSVKTLRACSLHLRSLSIHCVRRTTALSIRM